MATFATLTPVALVAIVAPAEALTLGTAMQPYSDNELHGQDFKAVRSSILDVRRRTNELSESILSSEHEDTFTYNTVPPLKSYFVNVALKRGALIPPVSFELLED